MSETFNPLYRGKSRQSTEAAPAPAAPEHFDTTTPAVAMVAHRFTLNDLPRYAESLYPALQEIFPHLHKNMYGGWLRSCIEDNATFFVCGNATVALAKMINDPLDPRPVVRILFCIGDPVEFPSMFAEMLRWAKDIGAREARYDASTREVKDYVKNIRTESRNMTIFHLD